MSVYAIRGLGNFFAILNSVACPELKKYKLRVGITALASVVLTVSFILFSGQGTFLIEYSPLPNWCWLVLTFNYVILTYFLFIAIKDWVKRGTKGPVSKSLQGYNA